MNKWKVFLGLLIAGISSQAMGLDSFICTNDFSQIEKDGYVHFVFDFDIVDGDEIEVLDYAADYKKISASVIENDSPDLVIQEFTNGGSSEDLSILIHRDQSFSPGAGFGEIGYFATLNYGSYKDYQIKCIQSGPAMLE